ncbi:MAG: hypothetical protein PWP24_867 [Clostridiales bacterium]|nr:hypothetical protein [Clostridiales bacterium]
MKDKLRSEFHKRQYMLSKDFELYYYSDRYLKQVENHKHDYYEFYFFLEGEVSLVIEGRPHTLQPGDMVLIPPGIFHYAKLSGQQTRYRRFVFWITKEYCNRLMEISPAYGYLFQQVLLSKTYIFHHDVIVFNRIQAKLIQIMEETQGTPFGKEEKIALSIRDLILSLNRLVYEKNHKGTSKEGASLYESLISYIENHLEEELSLETIAKAFYVSKYHIAHVMKQNMGISLHQYIMKKRLLQCREAILSGQSIKEAYLMSGFREYSSFFRAFKKEFGVAPAKVKKEKGNQIHKSWS